MRAGTQAKEGREWMEQVQQNGGISVSIDGIQPARGNETVYLVRDALTGRVLAAENVTASETAVMRAILAQVKLLEVTVLGTISDAQESLRQALEQLWPEVPHQMCQFHALQDASRPAYEVDRKRVYGDAQAPATPAEAMCVSTSSAGASRLPRPKPSSWRCSMITRWGCRRRCIATAPCPAEHILDGSWLAEGEATSNEQVGQRFDHWRTALAEHLTDGTLSPTAPECLEPFLQLFSNVRPYLIQCYDRQEFPRTN